jgi:beta-lactamase class A
MHWTKIRKFWPVLLLLGGFGLGWWLQSIFSWGPSGLVVDQSVHVTDSNYKLINPLVDCDFSENTFVELKPFQDKVSAYVDSLNDQDPSIDQMAVYFRDMNNGPWFGVNQNTPFYPASLLKLPVLIAYYQLAENNPDILKQQYIFHANSVTRAVTQNIPPKETLVDGNSYQVDDLLYRMIVYSDDMAQYVLMTNIDNNTLSKVYTDFGLPVPGVVSSTSEMSVMNYAIFFRVLFNASYLDKEYSEKAMELLAQSDFNDGLVAGLPRGVTVAHKFGERGNLPGSSDYQLHDCGIIYYPNHPYLLCVMSRGNDIQHLENSIAQVSRFVYDEIDNQYKGLQ